MPSSSQTILQAFNKELENIKENSLDYEDGLEKLDAKIQ
jgi:hypothetical protein